MYISIYESDLLMKKRKTIAIITADSFNEYINNIIDGISQQCRKLNYDTLVFLMTFNIDTISPFQIGEENVYNLINSEAIDGIIFMCGNFCSPTLIHKLEKKLTEMNIPIVAIDGATDICETLIAKDTVLFEQITDHFIEKHDCSEIMCLTGFKNVIHSQTRLQGYKNSLAKHNIPFDESLVVYGDFWKTSARQLSNEFVSGARKLPQAIVCANDVMAVELCNSLVDNGIRIPEKVLISGYDGSTDASENTPSITTIKPLNHELGARAVCLLHKKITGEDTEIIETFGGEIITAQSCGCGEDFQKQVRLHENHLKNIRHYSDLYRTSSMAEVLLEADNFEQLLQNINRMSYIFNGLDTYMLCLSKDWDNIESDENSYISSGYSEEMSVRMIRRKEFFDSSEYEFNSRDILPEKIFEYYNEPSTYFLLPMHFGDRCFGFSIFKFIDVTLAVNSVYAMWCRNINIALEFLRVRNRLISMNQRISLNSIRDTLTGVYNRKGFTRFSASIFKKAKSENKKLLILVVDLDMLKYINDNFGHIEGDNAITVCAKALASCCQNNEICARIGGDEYAVVGCFDYTDGIVNEYISNINSYFTRYNLSSEKPYQVNASIGYFCGIPTDNEEFKDCFDIADKRMYQDKFQRKKFRTS